MFPAWIWIREYHFLLGCGQENASEFGNAELPEDSPQRSHAAAIFVNSFIFLRYLKLFACFIDLLCHMDHTTPPLTHADLTQRESVLRVDGDIGFPGYVGFPTEG